MTSKYIEITPEDSREGVKLSFKKITNLIDSADCLKMNNYYDSSIVISIYALEEISRCKVFLSSIHNQKNITKEMWKELSKSHKSKLYRIIKEIYYDKENKLIKGEYRLNKNLNITLGKLKLNIKRCENFSKLLLFIRKQALYTDWKNGKWISNENLETMEKLSNSMINENKRLQQKIKNEIISLNI